ncbi:MAG: isocitrate lyase/PEP mutase family protein [Stackebrandtia sp.]
MTTNADRHARFRSLHVPGRPLCLPNAWDVASARVIEDAGAAAVATTSAGVAWSLGRPDGDKLDRDRAVDLIARTAAAVAAPVTADIESGYASTVNDIPDTIAGVVQAGAVGVNIEDALAGGDTPLRPIDEQAERLAAARAAAAGIPLFVNARVDTYLLGVGDPAARFDATVERAAAYLRSGADGIFVPGVVDLDVVAALVEAVAAPLNVMAGPGAPTVKELADVGVARISLGPGIAMAAYAVAATSAREFLAQGTYSSLEAGLDFGFLNNLMADRGGE